MARICVIREWYFPMDPRVSREVDGLVRAGHEVDLICATAPGQARLERMGPITIHRIPIVRRRTGVLRYVFEFGAFLVAAAVLAARLQLRRRYDLVQVNSLPDCLVFAALIPKLLGARVLLDLHECMPEYFGTRFRLSPRHPMIPLLSVLEQASIRFADQVITCTEQMRQRFVERGASASKITVVMNSFDEERFDPTRYIDTARGDAADGPGERDFLLVCHGTIDENYGLDLVIRAVAGLRDRIPGLRLRIYGDGTHRPGLEQLTRDLGLQDRVWFSGRFLPMEELLPRIAEADAGVVAIKRDAFRDLTHCNKMFDLIVLRKPVVISRTRAVEAYFGEDCFQLFESGDLADLSRAIEQLYDDPSLGPRLVRQATRVGEPYRWPHQRQKYVALVDRLTRRGPAIPDDAALVPTAGERP